MHTSYSPTKTQLPELGGGEKRKKAQWVFFFPHPQRRIPTPGLFVAIPKISIDLLVMGNEIHIHQFVYISMVDCINIIHLIWSICVIHVIHNTSHTSPLSSILILKFNLIHVAKVHPCNFISSISLQVLIFKF